MYTNDTETGGKVTKLLEKAFAEASKLPEKDQNAIAEILLAELASDEYWTELFEKSQDVLTELAEEALAELKTGSPQIITCSE